ncbi:MAG: HupE/UreJ family protein [Rhodospirillales bacterium]
MKRLPFHLSAVAAAMALLPTAALAHTGVGDTAGFSHGFLHPLTGIDHILAMMMVGVFAWQLGGRALWLVPITFVLVMALGGALGVAGVDVPFVETGIALSVIVLGAVVAFRVKAPVAIAMALVGLCDLSRSYARLGDAEMPPGWPMSASCSQAALLHAGGIGLGFLIGKISEERGPAIVRATGAVSIVAGLALLGGLI